MGWTEEQTLAADVNAIEIGHAGKLDLYETIGFIKREKPAAAGRELTPELFDAVFG